MLVIGDQRETTIGNIANELSLDKGNVRKTIQQLVEMGYVNRSVSSDDRRYTVITLNKQGNDIYKKITRIVDSYFTNVFKLIPDDEHDDVIKYFNILIDAIIKYNFEQLSCSETKKK